MRIGIITPRYPPTMEGGGEISVKLLADQLLARGEDVDVFSFDGGREGTVDGVPVHRFRRVPTSILEVANPYALGALYGVRDRIARCDILHAYNIALNPAVGTLSELLDVPSVATLNSYDLLPKSAFGVQPGPARRLYEQIAMPTTGRLLRHEVRKIDRLVALSDASKTVYQANGFDGVPIDVVPNMLDPGFDVPERIIDPDSQNLLYVGSLIQEKGVKYLIKAMSELPSDVLLRVVGAGEQNSSLHSLVSELNLGGRVEFMGQVPYTDLRWIYAKADVFVHPGVWPEPFGRTILEAMQVGLPVVTTDVGGPSEVVPQPEFRCPPRDEQALAETIKIALDDLDAGEKNREYVNDRFAPEVVLAELLDVYTSAGA